MRTFSLVILFGLFAAYSTQGRHKLQITILYESLCPDSINFITKQLEPSYFYLREYIDLEFVPFGKSESHKNGQFTCQHGPNECAGNKIQSCALDVIPNKDLQMAFINCQMHSQDLAGYHCSRMFGINYADILYCYNTEKGQQLQLQAEIRTKEFSPKFVPTILFNNKFDQHLQDHAFANFLGLTCGLIHNAAPVCRR